MSIVVYVMVNPKTQAVIKCTEKYLNAWEERGFVVDYMYTVEQEDLLEQLSAHTPYSTLR